MPKNHYKTSCSGLIYNQTKKRGESPVNTIQSGAAQGISSIPIKSIESLSKAVLLEEARKLGDEIKLTPSHSTEDTFKSLYGTTVHCKEDAAFMSRINKSFMKRVARSEGSTLGEMKEKADARASKWNKVAKAFNIPMALGGISGFIGFVPTAFCALGEIASVLLWPAQFAGFEALSNVFPTMMMAGGGTFISSLMAWSAADALGARQSEFSKKLVNWGNHIEPQPPQRTVQEEARAA
jgi:hypothetical protein